MNYKKFAVTQKKKDWLVDKDGNELKEIPQINGSKTKVMNLFFFYKYEIYLSLSYKFHIIVKEKKMKS